MTTAALDAGASTTVATDEEAALRFFAALAHRNRVFCAKSFRLSFSPEPMPMIPCLDHEAQLQGHTLPHVSAYVEDAHGELHEIGLIPQERRIVVDAGSTLAETSPEARERVVGELRELFPDHAVSVKGASLVRGDRRVAQTVRAQVRLREVLAGDDTAELRWRLDKLRAIAELMEKESRVSSWGVRTMTPLLLAAAGVATYQFLGLFHRWLGPGEIEALRYTALTTLGAGFLYVGMKAVHLTEMGTRVWKRATEYRLILDARARARKA